MSGCRALTSEEVAQVSGSFTGPFALRDKALFILGCKTGFRISELLSITVDDVRDGGQMADRAKVSRADMKGKCSSRSVALHPEAKAAILTWIESIGGISPGGFVFVSHKGDNKPITPQHAWRVLKAAFTACKLNGNTGTHSMRKTFAINVFIRLDRNLLATQKALGHKELTSTAKYLSFEDDDQIDSAVLSA